jgi:hypothetical protein
MADNLQISQGTGTTIAAHDEGAGVLLQRVQSEGPFVTALTSVTRPADTVAYSAGDAFADSTSSPRTGGFTFTGVARASGGATMLTDMLVTSSAANSALQGSVLIFNTAVTAQNDNVPIALSAAEIQTLVAIVPFAMGNGRSLKNNTAVHVQNLNIGCTCSGSANLRFLIRVDAAYTPVSGEVLSVMGKFMTVN